MSSQLTDLKDSGPADVKLSTQTRDAYLKIVQTFHDSLNAQLKTLSGLGSLGNPGTLASARQTKMNLELDISGVDGIQQSINQYLSYLDQFSTTVKAACTRLIQSG
ncbi:hypothetical protein ACTXG5_00035 [Mycobacterium sp. Dal123C01]|uniref:hypothetical protein n=1 Tax=Mycobacterium sp. Dal123C01 TaxID=3457577 RepID=UPI00403E8113